MQYTWDPRKAASNFKKHGVAFEEAEVALKHDDSARYQADADSTESRLRVLAWSPRSRLLFIVVVERSEYLTRIISARKANPAEEPEYRAKGY